MELLQKENDVLIENVDGFWTARHYAKGSSPKLIYKDKSRAEALRKGQGFAMARKTKIWMRTKNGKLVLNPKDQVEG